MLWGDNENATGADAGEGPDGTIHQSMTERTKTTPAPTWNRRSADARRAAETMVAS